MQCSESSAIIDLCKVAGAARLDGFAHFAGSEAIRKDRRTSVNLREPNTFLNASR